jgi:predicted site-specific integrase-resolvase
MDFELRLVSYAIGAIAWDSSAGVPAMKVAVYARVSTTDQTNTIQIRELTE